MADKDQFTFDDDDGFPETNLGNQDKSTDSDPGGEEDSFGADLSSAFSEGEVVAETPVDDTPEPIAKAGNSKTRTLLMVLLLVIVVGAGAYYFMGLGGTSAPSVPTVPVPAQKPKAVALPPKPAKAPAAKVEAKAKPAAKQVAVAVPPKPAAQPKPVSAKAESTAKPVTVAVPPPAKPAPAKAAPVAKPVVKAAAEKPKPVAAKQPAAQVAVPAPKPVPVKTEPVKPAAKPAVKATAEKPKPATTTQPATKAAAVAVAPAPKPVPKPQQVVGGAFALDAGSYLLDANRKSLVDKIKQLGYEPLVTPVDATLNMTRLRLGTFNKDEVQEALDFARSIEAGSYSAPAGDRYVIYAGTFLQSRNVEKLSQRFLEEGIKVHPEPVQVVRTLSRIRFGSFSTKEDAAAAAREVAEVGLKAAVVKSK